MRTFGILCGLFALSSCAHYQSYQPRQEFTNEAQAEVKAIPVYTSSDKSVAKMFECDKVKNKEKRSTCFEKAVEVGIANINLTYDRMDQTMVHNHFVAYRDTASVSYAKGLGLTGKVQDDLALSYSSLVYYEEMARISHQFGRESEMYGRHTSEVDFYNAAESARVDRIRQIARDASTDARLSNIERNTAPSNMVPTGSNVQINGVR